MIQSINGWLFFDPMVDELHEEYPRRTLAVNTSKSSGKFAIVCYDFPKGTDIRVEMNKMDMSGRLVCFEDAVNFVKDFKEKGEDAFSNTSEMNFGGNSDMQVMLDVNQAGDITRNGKMIDFKKELDRMRQQW
jgi:hypothetical protein